MHAVLEGLLVAGAVALVSSVLAVLWVRHRLRRRLRVAPTVRSAAPTGFLWSASPAARLHRRLRRVSMAAQLARRLDPGLTDLAADLIAEAAALEPAVLAVTHTGRTGALVRRVLSSRITELETVGRRLTALAGHTSHEGGATRVRERLLALEAARVELAEIDVHAGLVRHA